MVRVSRYFFANIVLAVCLSNAIPSVLAAPGTEKAQWREAAPLPYKVQEIYPVMYKQHIVVAGGLSPDVDDNRIGVSDRVVVYSLENNQWFEGPRLPEPRHHPMLVVINGRLLAFGGFTIDENGMWHNSTDVLELVAIPKTSQTDSQHHKGGMTGNWKKIANMPTPLAETLGAVSGSQVHLVSGRSPLQSEQNSQWRDQTDVNTHLIFDVDTHSWSYGKDVPTARNSACSVTVKDTIFTIGGRTVEGGNLATHEAYNMSSETWQTLAPLPEAQGGIACAAVNEHIYVFGGEFFDNGGGVYSNVWEYSIASDTWQALSHMPKPRHGLGAITTEDGIFVIAGALEAGGNQTSNRMSIFLPSAHFSN